ncbi:MAG: hypothetical protein GY828_04625 [Candidatus Gracilibacteria bacterium]|nr:hypothetical protein [Candidatus Gracilibacteria bacterium]
MLSTIIILLIITLTWNEKIFQSLESKQKYLDISLSKTNSEHILDFQEILTYNGIDTFRGFDRIWGMKNISFSDTIYTVLFPKGSYKPSAEIIGGGGFVYEIPFDIKKDVSILEYTFEIPEDFDFVKGGKLPGLCGGDCPTGGADIQNGFSARMMWRKEGDLELYGYLGKKEQKFGQSLGRGMFQLKPGKSYKITQEIQMNTGSNNDGIIKIFVNGHGVYFNDSVYFGKQGEIHPDKFIFSTFFGGGDESWASTQDNSLKFSNIIFRN